MTKEINDSEFDGLVKSSQILLVDCYADWCGPCKMMEPVIEGLSKELEGKATIAKMNIDENKDTPAKFGVMSIPTLLLFSNGKLVDRIVGAVPADMIKERLGKFL